MKRLLLALLLALSVTSVFAGTNDYTPVKETEIRYWWYNPRVPQSELAHIMIARDTAFFESSTSAGIYCDDRIVTDLKQGEVVPFNTRPGEHKITVGFSRHLHDTKIKVEAGHYYLYKLVWDDVNRGYDIQLVEEE